MKFSINKFLFAFLLCCFFGTDVNGQCDQLAINSVLLDPSGSTNNFDTDGSGTFADANEYAEVCNLTATTFDLSTVTIQDDDGNDYQLSGNLASGDCVLVVANWDETANPVPANVIDLNVGAFINNGGDYVQLVVGGEIICEVAAGGVTCPGDDGTNCVEFPNDTDGCVNTAAEGAVNCGGSLVAPTDNCTITDIQAAAPVCSADNATFDVVITVTGSDASVMLDGGANTTSTQMQAASGSVTFTYAAGVSYSIAVTDSEGLCDFGPFTGTEACAVDPACDAAIDAFPANGN